MEKMLVNRIYWAPDYSNAFTLGASGSQITVQSDGEVHQHNDLMAPGEAIMFWHSHEDYQTSKMVPQLPVLTPGLKYRLVIHGSSFPDRTVLYRVVFFDIQGHEISNEYFRDQVNEFIFPEDAVNYEVKVVNAGATDFYFRDIEITNSSVPKEANTDFWIQEPFGDENNPLLVLLIYASKRTKENYPELQQYSNLGYYLLPIVVEKDSKKASKNLANFLRKQRLNAVNIVACNSQANSVVNSIANQFPECQLLSVNQNKHETLPTNVQNYTVKNELPWISREMFTPSWPSIFMAAKQKWSGLNV